MLSLEESREQRAKASFGLFGSTPRVRKLSAEILVSIARTEGKEIEQWVLDVAEGRLPA